MTEPYFAVLLHGRGKMPQFLESLPDMPMLFDSEMEAEAAVRGALMDHLILEGWEWTIVKLQDKR